MQLTIIYIGVVNILQLVFAFKASNFHPVDIAKNPFPNMLPQLHVVNMLPATHTYTLNFFSFIKHCGTYSTAVIAHASTHNIYSCCCFCLSFTLLCYHYGLQQCLCCAPQCSTCGLWCLFTFRNWKKKNKIIDQRGYPAEVINGTLGTSRAVAGVDISTEK